MNAKGQSSGTGPCGGIEEGSVTVASLEPCERVLVDALESVFDHQPSPLGQTGQEIEDFVGYAVRAGPDGQPDNVRMGGRLFKHGPQSVNRSVSVRGRLEIGEESLSPPRPAIAGNALVDLCGDRSTLEPATGAEAAEVAEDASAGANRAVNIGAREARVDAHFPHAAAELAAEEPVERMISKASAEPVYRGVRRRSGLD